MGGLIPPRVPPPSLCRSLFLFSFSLLCVSSPTIAYPHPPRWHFPSRIFFHSLSPIGIITPFLSLASWFNTTTEKPEDGSSIANVDFSTDKEVLQATTRCVDGIFGSSFGSIFELVPVLVRLSIHAHLILIYACSVMRFLSPH